MVHSLFTVDGDRLRPTSAARSLWSDDQMHGVAVSGAPARGVELTGGARVGRGRGGVGYRSRP